jgi:hypothetical protein
MKLSLAWTRPSCPLRPPGERQVVILRLNNATLNSQIGLPSPVRLGTSAIASLPSETSPALTAHPLFNSAEPYRRRAARINIIAAYLPQGCGLSLT